MSGTSLFIDPPTTTQTAPAPARRTGTWVALLLPALTLFAAGMSVAVGLYLGAMTPALRETVTLFVAALLALLARSVAAALDEGEVRRDQVA